MKKNKLTKKQKDFLELYQKKALNIYNTCKAMNINRASYYDWINKNPAFKEAVEEAKEGFQDWVESQIVQCMQEKDRTMLIFYAKTKMKHRGYVERQEIQHSGLDKIKIEFEDVEVNNEDNSNN